MKTVEIRYTKNALKGRSKLSQGEQAILDVLEQDLRETAGKPYGRGWKSLGALSQDNLLHCHLTYKKVAVWDIQEENDKISITICRFNYIGTREKAPY